MPLRTYRDHLMKGFSIAEAFLLHRIYVYNFSNDITHTSWTR